LKDTISKLEKSTELINQLQLFSSNERVEDIQTSHLKYLMAPACLGYLTSRLIGAERVELVTLAIVYFCDYLQRLYDYKLSNERVPQLSLADDTSKEVVPTSQPSLEEMAIERGAKIRKFTENRQLDSELDQFAYVLKGENEEQLDDEVVRSYYLKLIRRWINTAQEEIKSLQLEQQMLRMFAGKTGQEVRKENKSNTRFKPFIITKNELQKQVYGLGYPSRPTVTIEEFVNTKIDEGSLNVAQG
jgi:immunoglobulin-binding protein 1